MSIIEQHELFMMERRVVDGGVAVFEWQAFCRCGWSMLFATRYQKVAQDVFDKHATCEDCAESCDCMINLEAS